MAGFKLVLAIAMLLLSIGAAMAYENEIESPARGGVYDDSGNYSVYITYYTPLSATQKMSLTAILDNETLLKSRVLLLNMTTKQRMQWTFYFPATGNIRDGKIILYSTVDLPGPKGLWEI